MSLPNIPNETTFFVTFVKKHSARTGNILFQYLFAKTIEYYYHQCKYIPFEECVFNPSIEDARNNNIITINDENSKTYISILQNCENIPLTEHPFFGKNVICDGFFQQSDFYVPIRDQLLEIIKRNNDYWYYNEKKEYIRHFFTCNHSIIDLSEKDVVISLRLDDFIQLPCSTSDIIPPTYYTNILSQMYETSNSPPNRLFIVCDKIRHDWEHKYLQYFEKYGPILLQKDLFHDCALMRDAPILIHSNSTLCWFMSFLSNYKLERYIPKTGFYKGQSLNMINLFTDKLEQVSPLTHHEVYNITPPQITPRSLIHKQIFPLSYCIPEELVVNDETLTNIFEQKVHIIAPLIPGNQNTYKYGPYDEAEYYKMYRQSRFAYTCKKGGWDCLRHYEIMANGCIPLFTDLDGCPELTLSTFPKELIKKAIKELLPYDDTKKSLYEKYVSIMMTHVRKYCTSSACAKYILNKIQPRLSVFPKKVLLIMGNCGVNYTRETAWIGIKRYIQSIGGIALEYPKIDFLYESFPENKKGEIYGNGFTYSRKIKDDLETITEPDIVQMTLSMFWDLIIFGKVGPDELFEGSIPHMPLQQYIFGKYNKNQIVFLYGGDGCQNMKYENRYSEHLMKHVNYGTCFVRELDV